MLQADGIQHIFGYPSIGEISIDILYTESSAARKFTDARGRAPGAEVRAR